MKLANYAEKGSGSNNNRNFHAGLVVDSRVYEVRDKTGSKFSSVDDILSSGSLEWVVENQDRFRQSGIALESVKLGPPILRPEKIYCAAVNYISHGKEQNQAPPSEPYFFTKFRNALIGPEDDVILPRISKQVDWEVELAVVIGKRGKNIPREKAMDYVAGYTISNDISFRDLQKPGMSSYLGQNWVKGKGLDTAFPLGPWIVTKDELTDPYASEISLAVNGIERQNSKVGEMVFKIDSLIEYLSADVTLVPGDIISTGTPLGVAAFTGAPFLKAGDFMEAKIQGIGTLRNKVTGQIP